MSTRACPPNLGGVARAVQGVLQQPTHVFVTCLVIFWRQFNECSCSCGTVEVGFSHVNQCHNLSSWFTFGDFRQHHFQRLQRRRRCVQLWPCVCLVSWSASNRLAWRVTRHGLEVSPIRQPCEPALVLDDPRNETNLGVHVVTMLPTEKSWMVVISDLCVTLSEINLPNFVTSTKSICNKACWQFARRSCNHNITSLGTSLGMEGVGRRESRNEPTCLATACFLATG